MTSALYALGSTEAVPQTEEDARPGLEPINTTPAEADSPADWNELETDDAPRGHGLFRTTVGGDVTPTEKYVPWWDKAIARVESGISTVFNRQADMGTAAKREMEGEQGHGTMQYTDSIDPVIRPGAAFGNDYFKAADRPIQEGARSDMQPIANDQWAFAVAQSRGVRGELKAANDTLYKNFYAGK